MECRPGTPPKKKSILKETPKKNSRSGGSGGKRCSKCKKKSANFFRLPYCPKKPNEEEPFAAHERYVAEKYLHDECMRRIGKKGETRKDERMCNNCKVVDKRVTLPIDHKGERKWQRFDFVVCAAEGLASSQSRDYSGG